MARTVQESLSVPWTFTKSTGNISFGAANQTYITASYFQPHDIANVGTAPNIPPTDVTQVPYYLYDYRTVSFIFNSVYATYGGNANNACQHIRVSGHIEYTLQNQTNVPVEIEMIRWTPKKTIPKELCAITVSRITANVDQFNPINFIGKAMQEGAYGGDPDASNVKLDDGEINLKDLRLWNEYIDYKVVKMTLKPGKPRKFTVGRKQLDLYTLELFNFNFASNVTDPARWAQACVPGCTGLLFRQYGRAATLTASSLTNQNQSVYYTSNEIILTTKQKYTAYVWAGQPESQNNVFIIDTGIGQQGTFLNSTLRVVNTQDAVVPVSVAV